MSTNPPVWARELANRVALDHGAYVMPVITWRRGTARLTSGRTFYSETNGRRIVVTAGKDRVDQKLVLLHELAHWLAPDASEHHGSAFWDRAWSLYRKYGVPVRYARTREGNYRKGAEVAYRRNRLAQKGQP